MSTNWKARPTVYKGIQMRSRLEAKYAQNLDKHGVDWEYEPKCFADETGQYLPDFVLRQTNLDGTNHALYVEIKPVLDAAVVAKVAPMMERIFASEPFADLLILAPSREYEFEHPDEARFRKGDWWLDMAGARPSNTPVFSSGRA